MKIPIILLLILMLALICPTCVAADVYEAAELQAEALEADRLGDAVPESAREVIGSAEVFDDSDGLLDKIWEFLKSTALRTLTASVKSGAAVICAVMITSAVSSAWSEAGKYADMACVLTVAAIAIGESSSLISLASQTLDDMSSFSALLLPVLATASAASGSVTSSAAKYAAASFFMELLISVSNKVVMPSVYGYISASVMAAAFPGKGAGSVASFLKWASITLLTVLVLTFTLYLSITGVISGHADAAAVKAARTTLTVVLPVVGSMISGAAESVVAGAGLVKAAVGAFGLIVTLAIVVAPVTRIGAHYLVYKATGTLAGTMTDSGVGQLLKELSASFGIILGLVGSVSVMLFISIISVIKAVT